MDKARALKELHTMQQAYATLFSVTNKIHIRGDEYFEGLTSRQFMTIVAILHLPQEETTLVNIAKKLGTTKQNVSKLLSGMIEKKYIEIIPCKSDKRAINVKLTELGESIVLKNSEKSVMYVLDLFSEFSLKEVETIWYLLKKLYYFDGIEQDGFEDEGVKLDIETAEQNKQSDAIIELVRKRRENID
ncbi:MAG: MarR family transcriptional regulator [Hungatella sp.]|nr:MarR family transcriptional regulator [Hungatella sp.]